MLEIKNETTLLCAHRAEELAEQFGTPFFLYDLHTVERKARRVREAFGRPLQLLYAAKANSNLELLRSMRPFVDGLDISSVGELDQALAAGYQAGELSFAGPGKTQQDLRLSITHGLGVISIESFRELADVARLAAEMGARPRVALRINPNLQIRAFPVKMGGRATQFGVEQDDLPAAVEELRRHADRLDLTGIHIYAGTQCLDADALVQNIENTLEIARVIKADLGVTARSINLGGGFGISYTEEGEELDVETVGDGATAAVERYCQATGTEPELVLELGRYLVADAGIYVARVVSDKESKGKTYFVMDGGMNHHLAASGNLGSALRHNYVVKNLSRPHEPEVKCNLVGPLCTPLDLMGAGIKVPQPGVGDLMGILNSGSYAYTASPLLFLGHPTPPELLHREGKIQVVRRSFNLDDFN